MRWWEGNEHHHPVGQWRGQLANTVAIIANNSSRTGASTANLSLRSIYVVVNTNLAACGGGITWVLIEYIYSRKFSLLGFCSGIISGLVGITPAAGYGKGQFTSWYLKPLISRTVPVYVAALVGSLTSIACFYTNSEWSISLGGLYQI